MGIIDRDTVAQAIIILAVSVGGWMMLVQPMLQEIEELESVTEAGAPSGTTMTEDAFQAVVGRMAEFRARLEEIERRNTVAGDTSRLYAMIMEVAVRHDVEVSRVQPGGQGVRTEGSQVSGARIDVSVEGAYEPVVRFLDEIVRLDGYLRPTSLRLTAFQRRNRPLVTARLTCEALQFDLSGVLAQMEGKADAQP